MPFSTDSFLCYVVVPFIMNIRCLKQSSKALNINLVTRVRYYNKRVLGSDLFPHKVIACYFMPCCMARPLYRRDVAPTSVPDCFFIKFETKRRAFPVHSNLINPPIHLSETNTVHPLNKITLGPGNSITLETNSPSSKTIPVFWALPVTFHA